MNLKNIVEKFGKVADLDLLESLGINRDELDFEGGDTVYVERPQEGYDLIFVKEESFVGAAKYDSKRDREFFAAFICEADSNEGYRIYDGELPRNISMTDDRRKVEDKLGQPHYSKFDDINELITEDSWEFDYYRLTCSYQKGTTLIGTLFVYAYYGSFQPKSASVKQLDITNRV
jgi:hypothetical protein